MSRILVRKPRKQFIEELGREVTVVKGEQYFVADTSKDFSTKAGSISKDDLQKVGRIKTSQDKEFAIFPSSFRDHYRRIKRLAQIIPLKDLGFVFAQVIPQKDWIVVEAGSGSGALSMFFAPYVGKIVSYEIVQEHQDVVRDNMKYLGIDNVELKLKSIYDGIDETDVDLLCLDLPEPWNVVDHASNALKPGAFVVNYSPSIPQTQDFVNSVLKRDDFVHVKTVEIIEREWEIEGRKVRPKSKTTIHSGFLSFVRKI